MAAQYDPAGTARGPVGMVGVGNMGGRMTRRMVDGRVCRPGRRR